MTIFKVVLLTLIRFKLWNTLIGIPNITTSILFIFYLVHILIQEYTLGGGGGLGEKCEKIEKRFFSKNDLHI